MSKVAPKQFAVQGKVFLYCQPIEFIFCKPVLFKISYVDKGSVCFVGGIAFMTRNRKHNPDDAHPVTILENASDDPGRICKVFEHVIHGKRLIVTRLHHGKGIVVFFRKIKFDCPSLRFIELHSDRVNLKTDRTERKH